MKAIKYMFLAVILAFAALFALMLAAGNAYGWCHADDEGIV